MKKNVSFAQQAILGMFGLWASLNGEATTLRAKAPANYQVLAVADGTSGAAQGRLKVTDIGGPARLFLLDQDGALAGPVVVAVRVPVGTRFRHYQLATAIRKKHCEKPGAQLVMGIDPGTARSIDLRNVKVLENHGVGYLQTLPSARRFDLESVADIVDTANCLPQGTGTNLGLSHAPVPTSGAPAPLPVGEAGPAPTLSALQDSDQDGLIDVLDVDRDNDGILNAYDTELVPGSIFSGHFTVFSNLKLDMDHSLNRYVKELADTDLDQAANQLGLAIQVAGSEVETSELNCHKLSYCSSGGTGRYNGSPFPDGYDADADGLGELLRGPTGDFQLRPNVSNKAEIGGGDVLFQQVTDVDGNIKRHVGMLNFVFNTTPALQSIELGEGTTVINYAAVLPLQGSSSQPFVAPADWDGLLIVTAFRPQRPGITGAGEAEFVDVGNSLITIDIPNGPCVLGEGGGGCASQGPGNCVASAYAETDPNLETDPNGLRDIRGDQDTAPVNPGDNTVSFTIDLGACLADKSIAWNSGESLGIDLQFRNNSGDNAAQKFYIRKP